MKDLKEYIISEDLKSGQLPHALAWYDYKTLVGDWIEEHPGKDLHEVTEGLMKWGRGRLSPRGIARAIMERLKDIVKEAWT